MQRDREMQHSMEIGSEIPRATIDAAMRIGHQAIDAYHQVATLHADGLHRSFEATRSLAETMLKAQSEMLEAALQMLATRDRALTENFDSLQRTTETAASQTAMAGSRTAQPQSSQPSQPKKAA